MLNLSSIWHEVGTEHGTRKILCDLDLDIAEIALTGSSLSLLLVWIIGLRGSWRTSFETTIPVMRDERLALVALGRSMRVYVINVRKVSLKPFRGC